jgi:hypothetical protein
MLRWAAALACALALCACGSIMGPTSITASRTFYNEVIHDTTSDQLLLNIVRAKNYEAPNFVDVAEADATVAFTGGVTGGATNIGAKPGTSGTSLFGTIGAVGGTATYGDSALVRYTPVQGFPLIQQVSSPILPESIVHMFDSDFALGSILEVSVDRLAPGYADNYLAQDRIIELDNYGAIVLSAEHNAPIANPRDGKGRPVERDPGNAAAVQALNLTLHNKALAPTAAFIRPSCSLPRQDLDAAGSVSRLWAGLAHLYGKSPATNLISLEGGVSGPGFFFTTRSAIGALKIAETDEFLLASPEYAREIRAYNQAAPCREEADKMFYFVPRPLTQDDVDQYWQQFFTDAQQTTIDEQLRWRTITRDLHRAFMIIEKSSSPPANAYVAIFKAGYWYSIDNDDDTSKANFSLLNEILTIQAVPQASPELQPSINVGGR